MTLCPGLLKNGRPCTNDLEERNKYCKMCGWKVDPTVFQKIAISCPNNVKDESYSGKCGTWIEKDQAFCDQCGWEVDQSLFQSDGLSGGKDAPKAEKEDFYNQVLQMVDTLTTRTQANEDPPGNCLPKKSLSENLREKSNGTTDTFSMLFVTHLNPEKVTTDALFNLFGCFGNVLTVKILYKRRDSALIQMETTEHAKAAVMYLDNFKLWDCRIVVNVSKFNSVHLTGPRECELTKDYTTCGLHRVPVGANRRMEIIPPSAVLYLSNLLPTITGSDIMEAFADFGEVQFCKQIDRQNGKALVQMKSKEEAAIALMSMHNFKLPDNQLLRVDFSKHSRIL